MTVLCREDAAEIHGKFAMSFRSTKTCAFRSASLFQKYFTTCTLALAAFGIGLGVAAANANGSVYTTTADDQASVTNGLAYGSRTAYLGVPSGSSSQFIGSGIVLDSLDVLAADHEGTGISVVGNGTNYAFDQYSKSNVAGIVQYPGYTGSTDNSVDLEIIHLVTPLTNADGSPVTPLTIVAPPANGSILTGAGFGEHGLISDSSWHLDGNLRAWNTPIDYASTFNPADDFDSDFGVLVSGVRLNGNAYLGDSGGPVFDSSGNLVGMAVAGTMPPGEVMICADVNLSNFQSWISANDIGTVPEPSSRLFASIATGFWLMWRKKKLLPVHLAGGSSI